MATVFDATQTGRFGARTPRPAVPSETGRFGAGTPAPAGPARDTVPGTNSVTASQARAARRREARRDEQAVAAWLRELARRTR
jgi:hypothetical protein